MSALPIDEHGFALHKGEFRDALALRYGWLPQHVLTNCACGNSFSVEHALSCPKGGYPTIRHNEIRDLTATLLSEVCHSVSIEPELQPITGENFTYATANVQDEARSDIAANGFWGSRFERTFFDVRVFNPLAPSNCHFKPNSCYRHHENIKKRAYEERCLEVEHASFTPLVMSVTGGLGKIATVTYKRLASRLSTKWDQPYSRVMGWLRCKLSFSLLRSAIFCIRGSRSSCGHPTSPTSTSIDLVACESRYAPLS